MSVTGVDMNRDGIPDVLQQHQVSYAPPMQLGQQPQVGYAAPVQYGSPLGYGSTMTVTGVDMNRDGIPDVLQQPQVGYAAPVQYAAPAQYAVAPTTTKKKRGACC